MLSRDLGPVTQLYVSVDASTKEGLKKIDRPLFRDFWDRFIASLRALSDKVARLIIYFANYEFFFAMSLLKQDLQMPFQLSHKSGGVLCLPLSYSICSHPQCICRFMGFSCAISDEFFIFFISIYLSVKQELKHKTYKYK